MGTLLDMTFINPDMGWFDVCAVPDKNSGKLSQLLYTVWLSRYLRPNKIIFYNGMVFKKDARYILEDYSIKLSPTTVKNKQAKSILENTSGINLEMISHNGKNLPDNIVRRMVTCQRPSFKEFTKNKTISIRTITSLFAIV